MIGVFDALQAAERCGSRVYVKTEPVFTRDGVVSWPFAAWQVCRGRSEKLRLV